MKKFIRITKQFIRERHCSAVVRLRTNVAVRKDFARGVLRGVITLVADAYARSTLYEVKVDGTLKFLGQAITVKAVLRPRSDGWYVSELDAVRVVDPSAATQFNVSAHEGLRRDVRAALEESLGACPHLPLLRETHDVWADQLQAESKDASAQEAAKEADRARFNANSKARTLCDKAADLGKAGWASRIAVP